MGKQRVAEMRVGKSIGCPALSFSRTRMRMRMRTRIRIRTWTWTTDRPDPFRPCCNVM
uniref:MIP22620p n=1 Tax=Drosophila melanogaster TaxID=7227 RepID=D6W4S4_DROME|nr:MIP22620p [Drosophila melanogaster]